MQPASTWRAWGERCVAAGGAAGGEAPGSAGSTALLCPSAGLLRMGCQAQAAVLPGQGKGMAVPSAEAVSPCSRRCRGSPTSTTPASMG